MSRRASILLAPNALLAAALFLPAGPAVAAICLWAAWQIFLTTELLRPRSSLFCPNFWRSAPQPRVAMTFDDGPHPEDTPAILEILERSRVRATFFMVGQRARAHPDLARRVAAAGHEIAVHSDTHPWWFSLASARRLRREVRGAARTIEDLTRRPPRFFRPPMGHKNLFLGAELAAAGLRMVTWTARSYDTLAPASDRIRDKLLARATPGGILLMHEGVRRAPGERSPTVAALEAIIEGLRARGLEPVSLGDLREAPETEARSARPQPPDPPA
jgi:peptidoglycan/xylan/chitin deacetylase (PgdA/CDA1 family)